MNGTECKVSASEHDSKDMDHRHISLPTHKANDAQTVCTLLTKVYTMVVAVRVMLDEETGWTGDLQGTS